MIKKIFSICRNIKVKRVYLQYFTALFLTALIFVLIMGIVTYFITTASMVDQISQQKTNTLVQTKKSSDITLKEIEKVVISKTVDPVFTRLNFTNLGNRYAVINNVYRMLVDCRNSNENIYSAYCYIPGENCIITSEDGIWSFDNFYDDSWLDNEFEKGNGIYWLPTRQINTNIGEQADIFSLLMPVQTDKTNINEDAFILVNIKSQKFMASIQGSEAVELGSTLLLDSKDNLIVQKGDIENNILPIELNTEGNQNFGDFENDMDGESYLVSYAVSDYNKWKYICLTPENEITKPVAAIQTIILVAIGLCILLGALAAILTSKKIYKPISDFMNLAKNYNNEIINVAENEIAFLNREFSKIAEENKDLNNTLHESESLIRDSFIKDMIENASNTDDDLVYKSRLCNISFPYRYYYVLFFCMDKLSLFNNQKNKEKKNIIFKGIQECINNFVINKDVFGLFTQIEKGKYAIIVNTNKSDDAIKSIADKTRKEVKSILHVTITVGISKRFNKLTYAHDAYCESLEAVKQRVLLGGDRIIFYDTILSNNRYFRLSVFKNNQIINCIKNANMEEVIKILDKTVGIVQEDTSYPVEDIINFFYFIIGQCVKTINEKGWSIKDIFLKEYDLYKELIDNENIYDMSKWLYVILRKMDTFMLEKKESRNQQTIQNILDYIHDNYDKDISLDSIADSVYLSPSYVSKIFKMATGKNFVRYLTEIRVEKAKSLLKQSKYKISEIGEMVNLGNVQNFIRNFKKYEGYTPGQYRESFIKNNLMIS